MVLAVWLILRGFDDSTLNSVAANTLDSRADSPERVHALCPTSGRTQDAHNMHVRFRLPDPVVSAPDREQTEGTWMSHADATQSVMMSVPEIGTFVRVLLPVQLTGGYTVTSGARRANALPGWDLLAVSAEVAVLDVEHTPYIVSSSDQVLSRVLNDVWPHEEILNGSP